MKFKFLTPVHDKCYGCIVYPTCVVDCEMIKKEIEKVERNCKRFDKFIYCIPFIIFLIGRVV